MIYIDIDSGRINGIYAGPAIPEDGREYAEVTDSFPGVVGQYVAEFDAEWNLRPLEDRLRDGLIPGGERLKVVKGELAPKSAAELVFDGIDPAPAGMTLDETSEEPALRPMTRDELVSAGQMTAAEKHRLDLLDEKEGLLSRLNELDEASRRPMRAIITGTASDEDRAKLAYLESEAQTLRARLAEISIELGEIQ